MNPTPEQTAFRAKLWRECVSRYQLVRTAAPETFAAFCAKFRERWVAGK